MTSVYLFRHAHTEFPKELIGGRSNEVPITKHGEEQARKLGLWIVANHLKPDFIAVSPAIRTRETARIALQAASIQLETTIDERLQELTKGDAEGRPRDGVNTPEIVARMEREKNDFSYNNGESNTDAATRLDGWVSEMAQTRPGETVFGFTHGIVTRCLIGKYLGWTYDEFNASVLDNNSATILRFDTGKLQDVEFNVNTQA